MVHVFLHELVTPATPATRYGCPPSPAPTPPHRAARLTSRTPSPPCRLDYHDLADVRLHADIDTALAAVPQARVFAFSSHTDVTFDSIDYTREDVLLFGTEPTGLPEEVMSHPRITSRVRIPMLPARRSLNLANAVSVAVYEAWRQLGYDGAGA